MSSINSSGELMIGPTNRLMRFIPNIFTLLNLVFGCLAIIYTVQTGLILSYDSNGESLVVIPEKIYLASVCIGAAAVIDFLDGFVARLLNVPSEMGKQLDSLADVVSFGVAPGMIIYQFLRLSYAQQPDGLDVSTLWLFPAFIVPCAGAYRLARFNIDTRQSYGFRGVPIPAAGLLIASFPLIYWYSNSAFIVSLFSNKWFWYAVIFVVSYLMVSTLPMLAMKFKNVTIKTFLPFIIIAVIGLIAAFLVKWMAVPVTFASYVVLSLFFKQNKA
ncbi:CDP-alcohol phosphatidyltransferase family protein [Parasediminibacterium sp. JCM 36343]|uniref:CDP-alcohol phosphatidyltransferase family protein n=1 Tax=Parasediminibacterium sp. JCM 36343 TaxID=3374279 RepID=UPI003978B1C6